MDLDRSHNFLRVRLITIRSLYTEKTLVEGIASFALYNRECKCETAGR